MWPIAKAIPSIVSLGSAVTGVIWAAEVDVTQGVAAAVGGGAAGAVALYRLARESKAEELVRETLRARIAEVEADRAADRDRFTADIAARDAEYSAVVAEKDAQITRLQTLLDRYRLPFPATPAGDPT